MKILFTIAIFMITSICMAQTDKHDWDEKSLNGNVKIIRHSYKYKLPRTIQIEEIPLTVDTNNYWVDSNSMKWYWVDSYNTTGYKLAEYLIKDNKKTGEHSIAYKFDKQGQVIFEEHIHNDVNSDRHLKNAALVVNKYFEYDSSHNLIKETTLYNPGNRFSNQTTYFYESKLLTHKIDSTLQGVSKTIYMYSVSDTGMHKTQIHYPITGPTDTTWFIYDLKGNLISESFNNPPFVIILYKYDQHNSRILREIYDKSGKILLGKLETKYIYDNNDNWILKVEETPYEINSIHYALKNVTIREIEYY